MGSSRRVAGAFVAVAVLAAGALGVTAAVAQQDAEEAQAAPSGVLEQLTALDAQLPRDIPPTAVEPNADLWADLEGDAGSVAAVLDTLEPELRQLFIAADDGDGDAADAVADVTRGWLAIHQGVTILSDVEGSDLAYPMDTADADGVATGADQRLGDLRRGLQLILDGRARLLAGYTALRDLGQAEPAEQALLDARAAASETFDREVAPLLHDLLQLRSTNLLMPTERFESEAPGVEARARSVQFVCIEREAYDGLVDVETFEELEAALSPAPERADCPDLPEGAEIREDS